MTTTPSSTTGGHLAREISLLPLVGLLFFTVSGGPYSLEELVSTTGPGMAMLLLAVMPIVYGVPVAAVTAELATAMPEEGGVYVWARRAFGDFAAFQSGLLSWLGSWVDMALYPVLFASYIAPVFVPAQAGHTVFLSAGPLTFDVHWLVGVVCVIVPMGIINVRGAKTVGDSSVLFAIIAMGPPVILAALGLFKIFAEHSNPLTPFVVDGSSIPAAAGAGLSLVMWSYSGFGSVGVIAGEIKNPTKVIPKALAISVILAVASYALPLAGALAVEGWRNWVEGSFADVGAQLAGSWLEIMIIVGGMFALIGQYSSLLMTSSRSIYVLAADRWAPAVLARVSRHHPTPVVAVIVSSVIYTVFATASFTELIIVDVFLINLLLMIGLLALIVLRVKEPEMPRPVKIPGGWAGIGAIGVPLTAVICFVTWYTARTSGATPVLLAAAILALSTLAYLPARRLHRRGNPDTPTPHAPGTAQPSRVDDNPADCRDGIAPITSH